MTDYTFTSLDGNRRVTVTCQLLTLEEVLSVFADFLKASGFVIEGYLDIVMDEHRED